jgi:hypothetical protein
MVDKDVTCVGACDSTARCLAALSGKGGDWLCGRKLETARVEVPARWSLWKRFPCWACSPRFARGILPPLYCLGVLHGAEGLTDFRGGRV